MIEDMVQIHAGWLLIAFAIGVYVGFLITAPRRHSEDAPAVLTGPDGLQMQPPEALEIEALTAAIDLHELAWRPSQGFQPVTRQRDAKGRFKREGAKSRAARYKAAKKRAGKRKTLNLGTAGKVTVELLD